jgi:pimeloyl-ACP methyl ester carboxylesterase
MVLAHLPPEAFADILLPTMFSESTPAEAVAAFGVSMRAFHPVGFRAMARASAENARDALARIQVPTLLLYGDQDVRAPWPWPRTSTGRSPVQAGPPARGRHVTTIEAPEAFNAAVRGFLTDLPEGA